MSGEDFLAAKAEVKRLQALVLTAVRKAPREYIDAWADDILSVDRRLEEAERRMSMARDAADKALSQTRGEKVVAIGSPSVTSR